MEYVIGMFDMTVWYVFEMPAFIPVAICASALFAMISVVGPKSIGHVLVMATLSAVVADIGFLTVWIVSTGQFGPLIGIPLLCLWILGVVVAIPTISAVWIIAKAVARRKACPFWSGRACGVAPLPLANKLQSEGEGG